MKEAPGSSFESHDFPKFKHLKDVSDAIIACVGTFEQITKDPIAQKKHFLDKLLQSSKVHNVDYFGDPISLVEKKMKNAGKNSYAISPIDDLDKFSNTFKNCTGLLVTGKDKETGKNISFLSHQDPGYFLNKEDNRRAFTSDLRQRTVDAVIVGGNTQRSGKFHKDYLESIQFLSTEVTSVFGFEPVVMTGPKTVAGGENVIYDNEHRRLYVVRPEVGNETTESFLPSDIQTQQKKW